MVLEKDYLVLHTPEDKLSNAIRQYIWRIIHTTHITRIAHTTHAMQVLDYLVLHYRMCPLTIECVLLL